jgi:hypothetical protein
MFIYYFVHVDRPFVEVESALLRMLPGLRGWAEQAYREGERLRTRIGTQGGKVAKVVEIETGEPSRGASQTTIPLRWEATGAPSLFPVMDADVVAASVGKSMTQIAFRGSYRVPLGPVGRAVDRAVLHRIAEASVKGFVDRIAYALSEERTEGAPPDVAEGRRP